MRNEAHSLSAWQGLILGEVVVVLIAFAATIVPSKTGSQHGIAGHLFDDPTFLQEFVVNLVGVHVVVLLLGAALAVWIWRSSSGESSSVESQDR